MKNRTTSEMPATLPGSFEMKAIKRILVGDMMPEQREVIVARHWGGLSFEQIAEVVGCSASTAFRRYAAGVEELHLRA